MMHAHSFEATGIGEAASVGLRMACGEPEQAGLSGVIILFDFYEFLSRYNGHTLGARGKCVQRLGCADAEPGLSISVA